MEKELLCIQVEEDLKENGTMILEKEEGMSDTLMEISI